MLDDTEDTRRLQAAYTALQAACPELDATALLVLLAVREHSRDPTRPHANTALIARELEIEHALVHRAAAELEHRGYVTSRPVGGASPALRLTPC